MSNTNNKPALWLIPTTLGEQDPYGVLPASHKAIIKSISHFIVENIRTARRFLKKIDQEIVIDELTFYELNKHTNPNDIADYLKAISTGLNIGIISEAGCPGVADPGADVVRIAHQKGICVKPLVGPSSILLALMASGLNGQNFAFNGYLPIKNPDRTRKIKQLENKALTEDQTQIFIETPYRNNQLIEELLKALSPGTLLCIATDISLDNEYIETKTTENWLKSVPDINKRPTVFLIGK